MSLINSQLAAHLANNYQNLEDSTMSDYHKNCFTISDYMKNIMGREVTIGEAREEYDFVHNKKDYINEKLLLLIED